MKKISLLIVSLSLLFSVHAQPDLQRFLSNPVLRHASVGIQVTDLRTGQHIVSHDADKSLTPASILKLITTAAALETFGDQFRYRTQIALDADDPTRILVLGSGDPTLGSNRLGDNPNVFFINAAAVLRNALSSEQQYSIYVVDNLFGYSGIAPGWTWLNIGNHYAPGTYGISIFDNAFRLFFNTTNRNACPQILRTEPEMRGMTFQNELTLNTSGADNAYIYGVPFSNERIIRGNIPGGRSEFSIRGDIPDPGMFLGETLSEYLSRVGIQVGSVETARADFAAQLCVTNRAPRHRVGQVLHTQESRPMSEIVREVNVQSNNHYSEHLIRLLGRQSDADIYREALDLGTEFVGTFLRQRNIATTSLTMYDGSGLAPQNAVSPATMNELLVYMYNRSNQLRAFFDSLPRAGMEGTVRGLLRDTKYAGKVWVKSGSIFGVQSFSGYLIDGEKQYAFTIMINNFNGTHPQVRAAIEQFLLSL